VGERGKGKQKHKEKRKCTNERIKVKRERKMTTKQDQRRVETGETPANVIHLLWSQKKTQAVCQVTRGKGK